MASGDFIHMEAGDTLAILKNETIIMNESCPYDYCENLTGDFVSGSSESDLKVETVNSADRPNCCDQTETSNPKHKKVKKLGHRREHADGGISYKKIHTSKIMMSIQLGVQMSVGGLAALPERDVLMMDFMTVESTSFTVDDSLLKSARNSQFILKTYAPFAFRHFRNLFGIKSDKFVSSFCDAPLVELPNPGASGAVFYVTQNDEFIAKTVQHRESAFLQKLLPGYYLNLNQNPHTLLPKFFGLFSYKRDFKNVRVVVMNNVIPSSLTIHQKYDLKGSTYNRKASNSECQKGSPTFKDLDFTNHHPEGIFLEADLYKSLSKTVQRDCRVLESFEIMDYSLLVGVHNIDRAKREKRLTDIVEVEGSEEESHNKPSGDGNCKSYSKENDSELTIKNGTGRVSNSASRPTEKVFEPCTLAGFPARQANGEKLLLFIGIIDILQSYRFRKRVEHIWKSVVHDGSSVSVHNPRFYAQRFQDFVSNSVFKVMPSSPTRKKGVTN